MRKKRYICIKVDYFLILSDDEFVRDCYDLVSLELKAIRLLFRLKLLLKCVVTL